METRCRWILPKRSVLPRRGLLHQILLFFRRVDGSDCVTPVRGVGVRFVPTRAKNFNLVSHAEPGQIELARAARAGPGTIRIFMSLNDESGGESARVDFEDLVERYYRPLYQFAFSLTQSEADSCDLTQQTFYIWATKGHQLRDVAKVKTWLFTTLHREFLESRRRENRFPHYELSQVDFELPQVPPARINQLDSGQVLHALAQVEKVYQAPVALFYLEDCSYKEIAQILDTPMGTVKSRIARGIAQLHKLLSPSASPDEPRKTL